MCGIFGYSFQRKAKIPTGQREVLVTSLAVANSYRGAQSWGVYVAGQKGKNPKVKREVGDIADVRGIGALAAWPVMFGHTRHATTGAVTRENQHPFRVGHILLAHNGMVYNHHELNTKYERSCVVDSQHFAHHLENDLTFSDIEAYGSLEWIDDRHPSTIHLARMRDGVLAIAGIKNRRGKQVGTAWSSDQDHLKAALNASRLSWFWYEHPREGQVYEVTAGKLFVSKRAALTLAETRMSRADRYAAQYLTSGGDRGAFSWWDKHYPSRKRTSTRTYTYDSRSGSVVSTDTHHARDTYEDDEGAWARMMAAVASREEPKSLPARTDDLDITVREATESESEEADYAAEATRLGLMPLDRGMWSDPKSGKIYDTDGIDDLLDKEEDEALQTELKVITGGKE